MPSKNEKCGTKPIFTPRSERCLKKICLENRFATTKQIKLNLKSRGILASERAIWRNLSKMNFKAHRPPWKPKLNPAKVAKRLEWRKDQKD
jgi:Transposase.